MKTVKILVACLGLTACQTAKLSGDPVELRLASEKGRVEFVDYHTESSVKTTEKAEKISRDQIDVMDFTTRAETLAVSPEAAQFSQQLTVTEKNGELDLHDMAFPELNEKLMMIYRFDGRVVKAGSYPKGGIFYVPPISLPSKAVQVGETWTMDADWYSPKNGLKMKLEMVTIFKRLLPCGRESCADLEVSGEVSLPGITKKDIDLSSRISGRILFALKTGAVVWSEIRNEEKIDLQGVKVEVQSCLESVMRDSGHVKVKPDCSVPFEGSVQSAI